MRRYLETFCRFWFLALIPLIVLPVAEYMRIRHTPSAVVATMNIYVDQSAASNAAYNQYLSPAQNEANNLNQWLQSPTFDLQVAQSSPRYRQWLTGSLDPRGTAAADLMKNVTILPRGDNLLTISYTNPDWLTALQVVKAIPQVAQSSTATAEATSAQQGQLGISYYSAQVQAAQQQAATSDQQLSAYLAQRGLTPSQIDAYVGSDITLATLSQRHDADLQDLARAQQQLSNFKTLGSTTTTPPAASVSFVTDVPTFSVSSGLKKELTYIGIALALGLLLGSGLVVLLTALDRGMRYADEVESLLGLPVLAVVPYSRDYAQAVSHKPTKSVKPSQADAAPAVIAKTSEQKVATQIHTTEADALEEPKTVLAAASHRKRGTTERRARLHKIG